MSAAKRTSPDHGYYLSVRERLGPNRAALSVGRKLSRRCYHTLRELGDDALAPIARPKLPRTAASPVFDVAAGSRGATAAGARSQPPEKMSGRNPPLGVPPPIIM